MTSSEKKQEPAGDPPAGDAPAGDAPAGDEAEAADEIASEKDAERGLRPGQSAKNFWPSTKRLVREIGPEAKYLVLAILIGMVSVALSVVGPKILGRATDIIFTGLISKNLPAGADPADVIEQMRAAGEGKMADAPVRDAPDSR